MIPQDKLDKFERGEIQMNDFSADEQVELGKIVSGELTEPEAPAADTAVKEEQVEAPPVAGGEKKEEAPPKGFVPGDKFKEKADEANTYRQRADSYSRQLEETRAELERLRAQSELKVEAPPVTPEAVWSDQHQLDLAREVARLKLVVEQGVRGSQEKLQKLEKELADQKMFAELNQFVSEFSELKLSRPFEEANAEYVQFTQKLGATPQDMSAVDRYFQDAAYRTEMESKGIKAPKDYDRLEKALQVYHAKNKQGYPTYRAAYLDRVLSPQELEKRMSGRFLEGVEAAVNKVSQNRQETTILDAGKSSDSGFNMTEAQMEAWINANPYPVTPQQKSTMAQIQEYIRAKSFG